MQRIRVSRRSARRLLPNPERFRLGRHPLVLALALAHAAFAQAAGPLPVRGIYEQGGGTITTGANSVTINQLSTRGVINWTSFSIGQGNTVTINNGNGATLNRVVGGVSSTILGTLTGTGSVYLMNPQGVLIGPSGVVTTGGRFLASSLAANTDAFMKGGDLQLSNGGNGTVVNMGKIGSTGGDVFLIARSSVENNGSIDAPKGSAELVAGSWVSLHDSASSRQVSVVLNSGGSVTNAGAIRAAQVALAAADGNVYALAGSSAAIRATGTATRDGHVWLIAEQGTVHAHGDINAADADRTGGAIDTTAKTFDLAGATMHAARWNMSAPTLTVDQASGDAMTRSLNAGTSVDASTSATGDVTVSGNIQWTGNAALTFSAPHSVSIAPGATIRNTGAGTLTLRADAGALDNGGGIANGGTIDWSNSTGIVSLFYDMSGAYSPGTLLSNRFWTAAPFSGLVTQITAYKLVNTLADLASVPNDLTGNYALGRDIDASSTAQNPFHPIGVDLNNQFVGQFDGFGHVVSNYHSYPFTDAVIDYTGLFGIIGNGGVVRNLGVTNANDDRSAAGYFGLLAGQNNGLVVNTWSTGSLETEAGPITAGGLVGRNDGYVERSWSSATLASQGFMGGLVGENNGTIQQSYASSQMGGPNTQVMAGGIASYNRGTIEQSYSTSNLNGVNGGGTIAYFNTGIIQESFGTGTLKLVDGLNVGALGGIAALDGDIITGTTYWNAEATQFSAGVGQMLNPPPGGNHGQDTRGLTNAQMSNPASFQGWTFGPTGIWAMPAGATHPVLEWQVAQ